MLYEVLVQVIEQQRHFAACQAFLSEKIGSRSVVLCPRNSCVDCHCIVPLAVRCITAACDAAVLSGQTHPNGDGATVSVGLL